MKTGRALPIVICATVLFSSAACNKTDLINSSNAAPGMPSGPTVSSDAISSAASSEAQASSYASPAAGKENSASAVPAQPSQQQESGWMKKAPMSTPRFDFGSAVVGGKIYVFGGLTTDNYHSTTSAEAYDPRTNKWQKCKSMPIAGISAQIAVLNGKIYAVGGNKPDTREKSAALERYDPVTDTWVKSQPMSACRADFSVAVLDGKIYAIGGEDEKNSKTLSSVEAYDPASGKWTKKASMLSPRQGFQAEAVNGKIYALGGSCLIDGIPHEFAKVEMYDPKTNRWTKESDMCAKKVNFQAETIGGKIYVIGGVITNSDGGRDSGYLTSVEEYDPATDKWTEKAPMKGKKGEFRTAVLNGKIYEIGGYNDDKYSFNPANCFLSSVAEYDPEANAWTNKNPLNTGRRNFGTATINDSIYVIGGTVGPDAENKGTESMEEYTATD